MRHTREDAFGVPQNPLHCSLGGLFGGGGGSKSPNVEQPASYFANSAPNSLAIAQAMQHGGLPFMQGFQPPFQLPQQQSPMMPQMQHGGSDPIAAALSRLLPGIGRPGVGGGQSAMMPSNPWGGQAQMPGQNMPPWGASVLNPMQMPSQVMPQSNAGFPNGLLR